MEKWEARGALAAPETAWIQSTRPAGRAQPANPSRSRLVPGSGGRGSAAEIKVNAAATEDAIIVGACGYISAARLVSRSGGFSRSAAKLCSVTRPWSLNAPATRVLATWANEVARMIISVEKDRL